MADVTLENVTKQYDDVVAVEDVNLDIEDGEFICLVGPSGCGKSTTLETIAGLTKPTAGMINIAGNDVTTLPPKDRDIAMVFQNIALFPHMDVTDNISFGLRLRDYPKDEINQRVERAADIVQLQEMLDRMPDELSGGQRQRVAIARAIVREPEVFLMDEPLANLDAKLRIHMRTELQRLQKQLETTVIYVTHDQAEAMTMSDRIAIINEGNLQQIAPPLECYNEPANKFVAGFIGSPSMNVLSAEVTTSGLETDLFDLAIDLDAVGLSRGDHGSIGVRPEDVCLTEKGSDVENASQSTTMVTDVLEPMGDEIFIYLRESNNEASGMDIDAEQLLMSVTPNIDIEEDESVDIVIDRDRLHVFDETGDAVLHGLTSAPQEVEH